MTEDEYLNSIRGRKYEYPIVLRTADPLLIRVNRTSLLVDNTNFFAKVKCGLAYNGYYIYSSGLGTPIAEVDLGKESITQQIMPDGTVVNKNQAWSDSTIAGKAEEFLNHLEARIYIMPSTNAIKEAIDRFCWQMHYDNTETPAELPEGFADIQIDKINSNNFKTFKGYFLDMNANITKVADNLKGSDDTFTVVKALREAGQSSVSGSVYQQTQLEQQHFTTISDTKLGAFGSIGNRNLFDTIGKACTTDWGDNVGTLGTVIDVNNKLGDFNKKDNNNDPITKTLYETIGNSYAQISSGDNICDKLTSIGEDADSTNMKLGDFHPSADTVASRIGVPGDIESTDSLFGRVKAVKTDTGYIGRNPDNPSTLWYDVLHYAGTQNAGSFTPTSLAGKVDTIYTKINNVYLTATDTGQTLPSIRSWSSNGHWGT